MASFQQKEKSRVMDIEKKNKLIYSGEFILIALVFLILGILEILKVIIIGNNFQLIFKIVTLVGATWLVTDFFWTLLHKKRRAKECLLDKCIMLPMALYLYAFDIYGFIVQPAYEYYQIGIPIAFFYVSCAYIFQGIYHYYKPVPFILEAIEEEKKAKEEATKELPNVAKELDETAKEIDEAVDEVKEEFNGKEGE